MYFAILGKHTTLSLAELQLIKAKNITYFSDNIIGFDTDNEEKIDMLGGIIKRGNIYPKKDLGELIADEKIIGIADKKLGIKWKKQYNCKRFKQVDIQHTDKEIQKKGKEIIILDDTYVGIVAGYQSIGLYEEIDFGKPDRDMKMGMMPAKLAHILLNIGIANIHNTHPVIYDPFAGSGTTLFLTNHFGYECMGSDIDVSHLETNMPRRMDHLFAKDIPIHVFMHDITQQIPYDVVQQANLIVTEGRLGPIVTKRTPDRNIAQYQSDVQHLYKQFLQTIKDYFSKNIPTIVTTVPWYIDHTNPHLDIIKNFATDLGRKADIIDEVYKRGGQHVGRKVLVLT